MEIETLGIAQGKLPPKALALVVEWASIHKDELLENWNLASQNREIKKIEPLK